MSSFYGSFINLLKYAVRKITFNDTSDNTNVEITLEPGEKHNDILVKGGKGINLNATRAESSTEEGLIENRVTINILPAKYNRQTKTLNLPFELKEDN